jgi:hypothetical protein
MQKPNPNDPSLIDVFDDATGAYLTTIPREGDKLQQLVQGPPATQQAPAPGPQFNMEQDAGAGSLGVLSVGAADAAPPAPAPAGDAGKVAGIVQGTADPTGAPLAPPGATDVASLVESMNGSADAGAAQPTLGGSAGGFQATERQTSGLPEEALAARRQDVEGIAELDYAAALDEATAMEAQVNEDEVRHLEMEREVKEARAKQAIEQKQVFDRRQRVEQKIAAVSAQEPDRHRAFPKGWKMTSALIGSIAGGMLAGLSDGRYQNQTLTALETSLDNDVKEQRETQSIMLKELTRQLGSLDAAEDMLRAKQKEIVLKELDSRLMGSKVKVDRVKLDAFRSRLTADVARHRVDALTKLERDETIKEVNTPGSAPVPFNAENYRARSLQQYATENGLPVKDAHKQWVTYNKSFQERATLRAGLDTAERLVQQYEQSGDVAGLGPLAKYIPSSVNTQDAKAVRQVLGAVTAQYLKAISGAAVTEQEYARTIENLQGSGDFDSVKRGLGILKQSVSSADEESQIENPTFSRLREELRTLNRRGAGEASRGRAEQEAAAGDIVTIPRTSRIAFEHNNPGNLMFAGQAGATRGEPREKGGYWAKFESAGDGMRALARQVGKEQERGLNVQQFVEKYAPQSDGNNRERYLTKLNRLLGVDAATPMTEVSAGAMAYAIAQIESGTRPNAQRK